MLSDQPSSGFCMLIGGTLSDWFIAYSFTRDATTASVVAMSLSPSFAPGPICSSLSSRFQ